MTNGAIRIAPFCMDIPNEVFASTFEVTSLERLFAQGSVDR